MKPIYTLFFAVFISITAICQEKRECNADMLINKSGVVLQREYVNVSKVKNISIIVEYITDISTSKKISALDLEYAMVGENSETVSVLLDPDEVQGLISFLENVRDNIVKSAAPKNYSEYSLMTKSGLEAGCYWENTWKSYIKLDSENSKTDVELNNDELGALISFIKQANSKMQ